MGFMVLKLIQYSMQKNIKIDEVLNTKKSFFRLNFLKLRSFQQKNSAEIQQERSKVLSGFLAKFRQFQLKKIDFQQNIFLFLYVEKKVYFESSFARLKLACIVCEMIFFSVSLWRRTFSPVSVVPPLEATFCVASSNEIFLF
jgi:hypothetical protein